MNLQNLIISGVLSNTLIFSVMEINCQTAYATDSTENNNLKVELNAELVSQYIWRGQLFDYHPQIQPQIQLTTGNFIFGIWGSQSLQTSDAEIDFYASYTYRSITLSIYDYFYFDESNLGESRFFNYRNYDSIESNHTLDACLLFDKIGGTNFSLTASCFFLGYDHNSNRVRQFSNYLNLDYSFTYQEMDLILSAGGTLSNGFYAENADITALSLKAIRTIPINKNTGVELSGTFTFNPNQETLFFTFGIKI